MPSSSRRLPSVALAALPLLALLVVETAGRRIAP
jgi:hypothetical protein